MEINWQHCENELDPESGETGVRNQDQINLNSSDLYFNPEFLWDFQPYHLKLTFSSIF